MLVRGLPDTGQTVLCPSADTAWVSCADMEGLLLLKHASGLADAMLQDSPKSECRELTHRIDLKLMFSIYQNPILDAVMTKECHESH